MTRVESGRSELNELMAAWRTATDARFAAVDVRFDAVDVRFEALDRRLDKFESRVDKRLDEVDSRLNKRMDDVESRLNVIESRLTDLFRWSFAFWIGSVAATVTLVHYVR